MFFQKFFFNLILALSVDGTTCGVGHTSIISTSLDANNNILVSLEIDNNDYPDSNFYFQTANCQFQQNPLVATPVNAWSGTVGAQCTTINLILTLSQASNDCGYVLLKEFATNTLLRGTLTSVLVRDVTINGQTVSSTESRTLSVEVDLGSQLQVSATPVSVYDAVAVVESAVVTTTFDSTSEQFLVEIVTTATVPYQLALPGGLAFSGWNIISSSESGTLPAPLNCVDGQTCAQIFTFVLERAQKCADQDGLQLNLDGSFSIGMTVSCRAYYTGTCPPSINDAPISFQTYSGNYCVENVGAVVLQGSLDVYEDQAGTTVQNAFIIGTETTMITSLTAPLPVNIIKTVSLALEIGGVDTVMYTYDTSTGTPTNNYASAPENLVVTNDIGTTTTAVSTSATFTWSNTLVPGATNGAVETVTAKTLVEITFQGSTPARRRRLLALKEGESMALSPTSRLTRTANDAQFLYEQDVAVSDSISALRKLGYSVQAYDVVCPSHDTTIGVLGASTGTLGLVAGGLVYSRLRQPKSV